MKVALIGYGKMGRAIEEMAMPNGHEIVLKISSSNAIELTKENLQKADVAIEFTAPESAVENLKKCFEAGIPVVCGSTGWLSHFEEIKKLCAEKKGAFLYASNFSIGVNLFFELNNFLAKLMNPYNDYNVTLKEIHHTQKKDAPSGTAITLAEQILANIQRKKNWVSVTEEKNLNKPEEKTILNIFSERMDPVPGTHEIKYASEIDDIAIIHTAHSRKGFAAGALSAAKYLIGRQGMFTMKDVIQGTIDD